jgi:hypothetical protein
MPSGVERAIVLAAVAGADDLAELPGRDADRRLCAGGWWRAGKAVATAADEEQGRGEEEAVCAHADALSGAAR